MAVTIQIKLNEKLYLRDPQDTELGRRIIRDSILLIDEIGFEHFTFKKLAERIHSTEASVYRYFENKHLLLVYLLCWYWEWVKYQIDFATNGISDPHEKLRVALRIIVNINKRNAEVDFVDEDILHRIVVAEGSKTYLTKLVDTENKYGFFATYKALARSIAGMISAINPHFPYPSALASTLLEMANRHIYFSQHLPSLTDVRIIDGDFTPVEQLLEDFAFGLIDRRHRYRSDGFTTTGLTA